VWVTLPTAGSWQAVLTCRHYRSQHGRPVVAVTTDADCSYHMLTVHNQPIALCSEFYLSVAGSITYRTARHFTTQPSVDDCSYQQTATCVTRSARSDRHTHAQIHTVQHHNSWCAVCSAIRNEASDCPSTKQLSAAIYPNRSRVYTALSVQPCGSYNEHYRKVHRPERRRSGQKQSIAICGLTGQQDDI